MNDPPAFFVVLMVFGSILTVAAILLTVQHRFTEARNETYRRLAAHFGGTATPGSLFTKSVLVFSYRGVPVMVDTFFTGSKHKIEHIQVHIAWPDMSLRMAVYPERLMAMIGKLLGVVDISVGAPPFDSRFQINGNNPNAIRQILSPPAQTIVERLRALKFNDEIHIAIQGGELVVRKRGQFHEFAEILEVIMIALEFYDVAVGVTSGEIEFLDTTQGESTASLSMNPGKAVNAPICQVCGEEIAADMVLCRGCRTPHHTDCWTYNGACSTYGCRETRFTTRS